MSQRIERDHQRFRKLVRGKVKSNLSKYISRGEMIGKKGKDLVSIPLPAIDLPQFRYGTRTPAASARGRGSPASRSGRASRSRGSRRRATSRAGTSSRSS